MTQASFSGTLSDPPGGGTTELEANLDGDQAASWRANHGSNQFPSPCNVAGNLLDLGDNVRITGGNGSAALSFSVDNTAGEAPVQLAKYTGTQGDGSGGTLASVLKTVAAGASDTWSGQLSGANAAIRLEAA